MVWADANTFLSGVPQEHRGDPQYEKDYWDAYDATWKFVWICICGDSMSGSPDATARTDGLAHMIAVDYADVMELLRR